MTQKEKVKVALREDFPRTVPGISYDTRVPQSSIRRILQELRREGQLTLDQPTQRIYSMRVC